MPRGCGYLYGAVFFILEIMTFKFYEGGEMEVYWTHDCIAIELQSSHGMAEYSINSKESVDELIYVLQKLRTKFKEDKEDERLD